MNEISDTLLGAAKRLYACYNTALGRDIAWDNEPISIRWAWQVVAYAQYPPGVRDMIQREAPGMDYGLLERVAKQIGVR